MAGTSFGQWLQQRRKALGLTQAMLGSEVGCAAATIRKIEADLRRPSTDIAERLARLLGVTPEEQPAFVRFARGFAPLEATALFAAPAAPQRTESRPSCNLPLRTTPLIGRHHERVMVADLLRRGSDRLITLTGPGGIGKSRLALAAAERVRDHFADGVCFVDLAPLRHAELVGPAIAHGLGVTVGAGHPIAESLQSYLENKQLLLVLDNFEHVWEAAPLISHLLAMAPQLKVLVTSRASLHLSGEHAVPVPPMSVPDHPEASTPDALLGFDSVALFVERARAVQPGFVFSNVTAPVVAEICRSLDGLPLAIELAAARCNILMPPAILARLENRLALLTTGARDVPARQQTLRATIDWSYELLRPPEQALFAYVSVFVGGWSLEALESICAADVDNPINPLDALAALLDQSLIRQAEHDGEPRFEMLETIREYALERLAERFDADDIRRRHATYYLGVARRAEQEHGPGWVAWFDREIENLRAALRWSLQHDEAAITITLATSLIWFWVVRGHFAEGSAWLEAALRAVQGNAPELEAKALGAVGGIALRRGEFARAVNCLEDSLCRYRALGDREGSAWLACNLGRAVAEQGDLARGIQLATEAEALFKELGYGFGLGWSLVLRGHIWAAQRDDERAGALYGDALALFRAWSDALGTAYALDGLAAIAFRAGKYANAAAALRQSLDLFAAYGDKLGLASVLETAAGVVALLEPYRGRSASAGRPPPLNAAHLLGAAAALREAIGGPVPNLGRYHYHLVLDAVQTTMDHLVFRASWASGGTMSLDAVLDAARTLLQGRPRLVDRRSAA